MAFVQKSVNVNNTNFSYWDNEEDSVDTIIYFPSGANTGESVFNLMSENLKSRVISIDYPGRGNSGKLIEKSTILSIAKHSNCFLKQMQYKNMIFIGTSFGTAVINEIINIRDILPKKIILVAPGEFFSPIEKLLINIVFFPATKSNKIRILYRYLITQILKIFPHDEFKKLDLKSLNEQWLSIVSYKMLFEVPNDIPSLIYMFSKDKIIVSDSLSKLQKFYRNHIIKKENSAHPFKDELVRKALDDSEIIEFLKR